MALHTCRTRIRAGISVDGTGRVSFWDILAALPRRWYVVVLGLACTALAVFAVDQRPVVYTSRATVFLVAPVTAESPNALQPSLDSLVMTAGVIAKELNGTTAPRKLASMDATIVGRGIWDGVLIQLPDNGGQWSANYNSQTLDVQVAAATPELVRERQSAAFALIDGTLRQLQGRFGVPVSARITTEHAPAVPPVVKLDGRRSRALAMVGVLGASGTLAGVYAAEAIAAAVRRRRRSR